MALLSSMLLAFSGIWEAMALICGLADHSIAVLEALYISDTKDHLDPDEKVQLEKLAETLKILIENIVEKFRPYPEIYHFFQVD